MLSFRKTATGGIEAFLPVEVLDPDDPSETERHVFTLSEREANALVVTYLRGPMGPAGPMGPMGVVPDHRHAFSGNYTSGARD